MRWLSPITQTRRARRRGGFTLIELVVVIVIVAILAAAAAPALNSISATRRGFAARQLLRDLTFARQRAVATGVPCWVVFDTTAETWTLRGENSANPGKANAVTLIDPGTGQNMTQRLNVDPYANVQIETALFDGSAEVGFDWLGCPLNASENPLAVTGSATLTGNHIVSVAAGTGEVRYTAP